MRKLTITTALCLAACSGSPKQTPIQTTLGNEDRPPLGSAAAPSTVVVDAKPEAGVIDPALAAKAGGFVDAFTNVGAIFTRDGKRTVFMSNRDGFPQLYVAGKPDEPAQRLIETKERMAVVLSAPGGKDVVFTMDAGADEQWSLYRVGLDGKNLIELTPGAKLNRDVPVIPDGKPSTMYFTARKRSEAKSTLYAASATAATAEPEAIYTDERSAFLLDVSQDGAFAIVEQYPSQSENYLLRVDIATGKAERIFPTGDKKVSITDAKLSRDGKRVFVATDLGEEQTRVLALDAKTGKQLAAHAVTPATAAINRIAVAKQGGLVALSVLAGNHSQVRLLDGKTLASKAEVKMPLGQGFALAFSEDGKRLALQWSTPSTPTDLFAVDVKTGKVEPLRKEDRPSLKGMPAIEATLAEIPAFDGGKIPTNVYLPSGDTAKKRPVIVAYHGGPASTSVIRWNAMTAFFLSLGYAVVEPNVRGSSGFGRKYEEGDNGPARLDAFKDIETSARWVAAQPWADKDRLVVFGGSYGGYTTLIALSRWPEIWRAGVNLFGVVDLKSFMATTSGVIRDIFLLEFGDPDKDAAFLASISPLTDVGKIVDPTFVYAGANDPRVPRSESDLIVKALRARKVPSEYMVADNEGHSLSRKENQVAFLARCARFLEAALK
jgi:dipeptidyl aminopeptidase/acylaminoacyl peptidase